MPALQPPSMQIAALPMGASTLSPQPAGPSIGYGFDDSLVRLIQQRTVASSAALPSSLTLNGITATQAGSRLVLCVAYACTGSAPVLTPPAGWNTPLSGLNAGNTLGGRLLYYPNNPGGITSVALTSLSNINGLAMWFAEFAAGVGRDTLGPAINVYNSSSAAVAGNAYADPLIGPLLLCGLECDLTTQSYTPANVGAGWVVGTTATSSAGATNVIVRPFWTVTTPNPSVTYQIAGTLAGAIANGVSMLSMLINTTGPLTQPTPEVALVGAIGGGLGPTKPGGAGGGQ